MSSERKAFLVWWTALLLFIAVAAYVKHNKGREIHGSQENVTTVNPASTPARELVPVVPSVNESEQSRVAGCSVPAGGFHMQLTLADDLDDTVDIFCSGIAAIDEVAPGTYSVPAPADAPLQ